MPSLGQQAVKSLVVRHQTIAFLECFLDCFKYKQAKHREAQSSMVVKSEKIYPPHSPIHASFFHAPSVRPHV